MYRWKQSVIISIRIEIFVAALTSIFPALVVCMTYVSIVTECCMIVVAEGNQQTMNAGNTPPPTERHMHPHQLPLPTHHNFILSELPEPPIAVSEIGPIPPPPMFSSPSPTMLRQQGPSLHTVHISTDMTEYDYEGK